MFKKNYIWIVILCVTLAGISSGFVIGDIISTCSKEDSTIEVTDIQNNSVYFKISKGAPLVEDASVINSNENKMTVLYEVENERPYYIISDKVAYVKNPIIQESNCQVNTVHSSNYSIVQTNNSILISDTDVTVASVNSHNVNIIVNDTSEMKSDIRTVLNRVVSQKSDLSDENESLTYIYLDIDKPTPNGKAIEYSNGDEIWVSRDYNFSRPVVTWYHETVHSVQNHDLGPKMKWFKEGSAEYIGALYANNRKNLFNPSANVTSYAFNPEWSQGVMLSDKDSWNRITPYNKGGSVLLFVDVMLRKHSNKTILSLFQWANSKQKVTYSEFRNYVVEHTNTSIGSTLDKYVKSDSKVPNIQDTFPLTEKITQNTKGYNIEIYNVSVGETDKLTHTG